MDNKNVFIAIALSMSVLLFWAAFFENPKPANNNTTNKPDYYLHETNQWLVFPHELEGLSIDEIKENKPELQELISKIKDKI